MPACQKLAFLFLSKYHFSGLAHFWKKTKQRNYKN